MLAVILIVIAWAGVVMAAGRRLPSRAASFLGVAVAVYLVSCAIWLVALMMQLVPVDAVLAALAVDRLRPPWNTLLFCAPPLIPALVFASFSVRRFSRR
jgi:hypothetical protein